MPTLSDARPRMPAGSYSPGVFTGFLKRGRGSGHVLRRAVALAGVLVLAVILMASDPAHDATARLLARASVLIDMHPVGGALVFILLSVFSAMLAFVSSAVVIPVAVLTWGREATMAMLWMSWLLGGCCSYLVGRTMGRRVVEWLVSPAQLGRYSATISSEAGFFTILLFQLAVPSEIPGYVLGVVRYRFPLYLAALALAEIPFAIGAVYLGHSFLHRNYALLMLLGGFGIVITILALHSLHRVLGRHPTTDKTPGEV